ncbi:MAG: chromosomal replication initiator DnaA [Rhizobiaceae bacterium]|nr:chromosomal replication initiator DnaA [Rhizobiaceae bacterium]
MPQHPDEPAPPVAPWDLRRGERIMEVCEGMIDICAALFNVSSKDMRRTGRTAASVSRVRQIAMYVTHVTLGVSMLEVGRGFFRDRTTVRHACHLIEDLRDDEEFDRTVARTERIALAAFKNRLES